jgi:hypothetical protein
MITKFRSVSCRITKDIIEWIQKNGFLFGQPAFLSADWLKHEHEITWRLYTGLFIPKLGLLHHYLYRVHFARPQNFLVKIIKITLSQITTPYCFISTCEKWNLAFVVLMRTYIRIEMRKYYTRGINMHVFI